MKPWVKALRHVFKKRRFWLLLGLGIILAYWGQPAFQWLTDHNQWIMTLRGLGPWACFVFIAAHILATACGVPGTVLVVAGGAVFGVAWGTLWSVIGATLGAIAAFSIARYLLRDWFLRRFNHHPIFKRLNQLLACQALRCVLAVRFVPISPFNLVNFLFGLTSIPLRSYSVGTFLGIIPGTFAYTWLGVTGAQVLMGEGYMAFVAAMGLLVILSLLPLLARFKTG
ncbi:MAG: TVP38/TMEM64 family protein [Cyanobacteria bacterium J06659_2]